MISDYNPALPNLAIDATFQTDQNMKIIATGLLVLAAVLYVPARLFETVHPAVGYLRALCEAAMIGGLADWFAVTALFRHPLGVPLAHTAIIPKNKERIADALGRFVEFNFLSSEVISERLSKIDFAQLAAGWMADPERSHPAVAKVVALLPRLFSMSGAEPLREFARLLHAGAWERADVAPVGSALSAALADQSVCRSLVDRLFATDAEQALTEEQVRPRIAGFLAELGATAGHTDDKAERLAEFATAAWLGMRADPQHPGRELLARWLHGALVTLREAPEMPAVIDALKQALVSQPESGNLSQVLWDHMRAQMRDDTAASDSRFCVAVQAAVVGWGKNIGANPLIQFVLNGQLRGMFLGVVERHRHHAASLIADTMRTWDAETMSGRVEEAIGRDLQFIRINGTVIGGLIGVLIHAISTLAIH